MSEVNRYNKKNKKALKIRGLMYLKGFTFSDVYKSLNVSRQFLWALLNGKRTSRKKKEELAKLLGLTYEELWEEKKEEK